MLRELVALLAVIASLLTTSSSSTAAADRPNVILVLIDDLGWKDLGCTGSTVHRTPNLDRLAARGVVFDQAYASAPNCAPTRACLMTGLWTPRHGVYTVEDSMGGRPESRRFIAPPNDTDLDPSFRTIAEMFRDAGYATACVGKWNLGQGTDTPHSPTGQGFDEFRHYKRLGFRDGYFDGERYSTDVLFDETIDVARQAGDRPFFIFLAPDAVHTPLAAPEKSIAAHPDLDRDRATYAAMVEHVDRGIGRLVAQVPENTIIVFTSDNGGDVSDNAPLRADKGAMYEGGIRVPLIVAGPGVRGGRRSTTPCQSIDLVPTLLELCDVTVPQNLDGASLAGELRGGDAIDRTRLHWHFPAYIGRNTPSSVLRDGDWKIIESLEDGSVELYDLASDPGETTDLSEREPARTRAMLAALKSWQRETAAPGLLGPNPDFDGASTTRQDRGARGGREGGGTPRPRDGAGRGQRRTETDPPAERGRDATPARPARERPVSIPVAVYADNWFELHINGRLVAIDPIEFTPHNIVRFEIVPEYPMTIAVQARDFADPKTGLEYEGTNIGDGGFIMTIGDAIVTDEDWKVRTIHHGPLDRNMSRPRVRASEPPANWTSPEFDDSSWAPATVHARERVRPNADGFDEIDWHGAEFIWDGDLDLDNTVLFRRTITRPPSTATPPDRASRGGQAGRPERPERPERPGTEPWLAAHVSELDTDGDSILTRAELDADLAVTMRGGDQNQDDSITRSEADSMRGVRSASAGFLRDHFDEIDADDDARVTAAELTATFVRMFERMDRDGDGRLTSDERAAERQGGREGAGGERGRGGQGGRGGRGAQDGQGRAAAEAPTPPVANIGPEPPQVAAFRAFDETVDVRWDEDWIYVESDGLPTHPMMVGITAWNQQVPIPHAYRGGNAFRIPRRPVVAATPTPIPYDGPIAVAVNGIPIFNAIKQDGRTDTAAAGELDRWGGHAGRGDDYHYHVLPTHLASSLPDGAPIAFAMDGYPVLGPKDLVGRRQMTPRDLDSFHGHTHPHPHPDGETWLDEPYHVHGSFDEPPYLMPAFRGEVDLANRPVARGVRPDTKPLRGATVTGFEQLGDRHWRLEYGVRGGTGVIDYRRLDDGTWQFDFTEPDGSTRQESHAERDRRPAPPTDRPGPGTDRTRRRPEAPAPAAPRPSRDRNSAEDGRPRSVLLVVADDLGFADVGFHGTPVETPHLDELRADGVELSRYYTMHTCGPTRAGIITGCTSYRVGVTGNPEMLGPGVPTSFRLISEAFQDAGHRTAMLGKWHAGGAEGFRPTERGFDSFLGCLGGAIDSYTHEGGQPRTLDWWRDLELSKEPGYTTDLLADEAVRVIESSAESNQPFFIMLSYDAVHGPLRAPDELVAKYRGRGVEDSRRATMLAMIEAMDAATGRVLDAIDRTDRTDETIVVFVSDNGGQEPYGINTPWRGWKGDLYEGGVHGIGVVRAPGLIKPGTTNAQPIAMYDLFPTLAGLAGVPTGAQDLDGVDLSATLTSGRLTARPPIAVGGSDAAIIDGDWKLLRPRRGAEELYNLATDPAETTNRLADEPEIAARLRAVAEVLPRNQAFQKSGGGRGGRGSADDDAGAGGGRGGGGGGGAQRDPERRRQRQRDPD